MSGPARAILIAALFSVAAGALRPAALHGQAQAAPRAPHASGTRLAVGGLLGGGGGIAVGGLLGVYIGGNHCIDDGNPDSCHGLEGFAIGAAAGTSVGIPLGVHLANGRAGRTLPAIAVNAALAGVGAALIAATGGGPTPAIVVISVPAAQLLASALIERRSAR